jgi:hypothetical protein
VGGVVIGDSPIELTRWALSQSFVALAGLTFTQTDPAYNRDDLKHLLNRWNEADSHHDTDQAYNKDYTRSPTNAKIAARNHPAGRV